MIKIIEAVGRVLEHTPFPRHHALRSLGSDLVYLGICGFGRHEGGAWWHNGDYGGMLYPSRIPAPKYRFF